MLRKIANCLLWGIAICYALFAFVIVPNIPDRKPCKGVLISVANDGNGNLTHENVIELLDKAGLNPDKMNINEIETHDIEEFMNGISLVKECQVYKSATGKVNIDIECRTPRIDGLDEAREDERNGNYRAARVRQKTKPTSISQRLSHRALQEV